MKTDRELLELAAKAAGIKIDKSSTNGGGHWNTGFDVMGNAVLDWHNFRAWNPLIDDGDALRLAVKLNMTVRCYMGNSCAQATVPGGPSVMVDETDHVNPDKATRRAIVRAAAAIGEKHD